MNSKHIQRSIVFLVSFGIYLGTIAPGVTGYDSAELATGVYTLGIVHPTGYPVYLLIGKLFSFLPVGDIAFRLNIMSAVFASLTAVILFEIIHLLLMNRFYAFFGALFFSVTNYFWQMALITEVYTLHTFFMVVNLLLILKWRQTGKKSLLFWFAIIYGLSLGNHITSLLFAPGFAWLAYSSEHRNQFTLSNLVKMGILFSLGLSPYLYFPIRSQANPVLNYAKEFYDVDLSTIYGFYWMVSGKAYRFYAFSYSPQQLLQEFFRFIRMSWRNFMGIGFLGGIAGLVFLFKPKRNIFIGLGLIFLVNTVFFINYGVIDKETMFLPSYIIWMIFFAYGLSEVVKIANKWLENSPIQSILTIGAQTLVVFLFFFTAILNWNWTDMSESTHLSHLANEVFINTEENATILASWSPAVVLEYYQIVEGVRPDITIINRARSNVASYYHLEKTGMTRAEIIEEIIEDEISLIETIISDSRVYITDYEPLFIDDFDYIPIGNYFQLKAKHQIGEVSE